ncbi:MAG: OstA-like protein [Flavobacteriales bacterium]
MKKFPFIQIALFLSAFFLGGILHAQKKTLELLPGSEKIYFDKASGRHRLVGTVSFAYHGNTMYCDSAHYQDKEKIVHAYGNVHIRKGDVNLYCDSLFYDEANKYAKLWGDVKVRDQAYKLSSDSLDYDAKKGRAIYRNNGKIESILSNERITSKLGYFYPNNGSFFFSGKVNYVKNDLKVDTDTLQFAYEQQKLYFFGPTNIQNDSIVIHCKKGWYHVETEEGVLYKQAEVIQETSIIRGDTLFLNTKLNNYEGRGNVFYKDFSQNMAFMGNQAKSSNTLHQTFLTGNTLAFKVYDGDTLYVHADSLILRKDSLNRTTEMLAHRNVRMYNKGIQGICDSAYYLPKTEELFLKSHPKIWAENAELKGTTMKISMQDSSLKEIVILDQASAVMEIDSGQYYNQLAGRTITAYFEHNELVKADVKGNAWTIFYPEEEKKTDSSLVKIRKGMNRLYASDLLVELDSGEVKSITYYDKPDGIFYPMNQIKTEEQFIKGFSWNPLLRPKDPYSIRKDY